MADDAEVVSTVEWGATPPGQQIWMDRLTTGAAAPAMIAPRPRFRPNYVALGLAVVGFLLAAGAQYMPWVRLGASTSTDGDFAGGGLDVHLSGLPGVGTIIYGFSLLIGFGLVGLLLFAEANRRLVAGATIGVLAGNLLALIELSTAVDSITGELRNASGSAAASLSTGFYLSVGAVVLLIAAAAVAASGWPARGTRDAEGLRETDLDEPIDLTVTGLGTDIG